MPESVTFRVTTYQKLARDEVGLTQIGSQRIPASRALDWILSAFPEDAMTITHDDADAVRIDIDWAKVPEYLRNPKIPARRR